MEQSFSNTCQRFPVGLRSGLWQSIPVWNDVSSSQNHSEPWDCHLGMWPHHQGRRPAMMEEPSDSGYSGSQLTIMLLNLALSKPPSHTKGAIQQKMSELLTRKDVAFCFGCVQITRESKSCGRYEKHARSLLMPPSPLSLTRGTAVGQLWDSGGSVVGLLCCSWASWSLFLQLEEIITGPPPATSIVSKNFCCSTQDFSLVCFSCSLN